MFHISDFISYYVSKINSACSLFLFHFAVDYLEDKF